MEHLYLTAISYADFVSDLEAVGLTTTDDNGDTVPATRPGVFEVDYIGVATVPGTGEYGEDGEVITPPDTYPAELVNVKADTDTAAILRGATFEFGTVVLAEEPETPVRVWQ